jgi:hypothetical protein
MFRGLKNAAGKSRDARRRPKIPEHLTGGRYLAQLQRTIAVLAAQHSHGNLKVSDAHVLALHLLAFFNPVVRSLRMMDDLSQTPVAQRYLGNLSRVAKSTLSDAHGRVDPSVLLPVLRELMSSLPAGTELDGDLAGLRQQIPACDATYFQTIADLAWAIHSGKSNGKPGARVGLHVQIDVCSGVPYGKESVGVELGDANCSESTLAARHVVPARSICTTADMSASSCSRRSWGATRILCCG